MTVQLHIECVGGGSDMAGQQFEANLGDSGHSGADWETGHLAGKRTPASYLPRNEKNYYTLQYLKGLSGPRVCNGFCSKGILPFSCF